MKKPASLKKGDLISLVAPSGSFTESRFQRGKELIEKYGFRVCYDRRIFDKKRYLAGDGETRAEIINNAFKDKEVKGVIAVRGGFGACQVLPHLDFEMIGKNVKVFCGSSDVTLLNTAFEQRCGMVNFYGPMPGGNMVVKDYNEEFSFFFEMMNNGNDILVGKKEGIKFLRSGKTTGRLTGGCLSVINSAIGTKWEIETEGKILFLEDVGEAPYRIERMLWQLDEVGKLSRIKGLIIGHLTDMRGRKNEKWNSIICEVIEEITKKYNYPVLFSFPVGHGYGSITLPVGGIVEIDSDSEYVKIKGNSICKRG
ncbi:MAG: LD-carboxypeptidase [Candidatus Schekmanbacteria bacterium]|nr:MAG: LD-carboxypeptidase [Candidatus Schekmanbacteria bacterium]